ncbi:hypothetical protein phiAb1151011551_00066 [Acinetobacter phage Ab11510-phi]|nr:hypothetical protein phiAb1151011551_00066 [Acinetobacter phage Ab11510-phi]
MRYLSHQITKKSQTSDRRDFYSMSEKIMNQRIEKYKLSQAFRDGSKAFVAFWIITFIAFAFLKGCADEQHVNELKAKQNMYVRVQVEGAN